MKSGGSFRGIGDRGGQDDVPVDRALAAVGDLRAPSAERDNLWFALRDRITTRTKVDVMPANSAAQVTVTNDLASVELIAAWEWLQDHERDARQMTGEQLERTLRWVATKSRRGSARAALADLVRGVSEVPSGVHLRFELVDKDEKAAS